MLGPGETIVITGGAGQLGRALTRELGSERPLRLADLAAADGPPPVLACDVRRIEEVREVLTGASAVCHLAGLDFGRAATEEQYVAVNVVGAWNVLQAAAEVGCSKVVLASSICAYGLLDAPTKWAPEYLPIDEDHPQRPFAAYSASKVMVEEAGRTWVREADLEVVALQPAHVVSTESFDEYLSLVGAFGPGWLHSYVLADDVARAARLALETPVSGYEQLLISADEGPFPVPTLDWYSRLVGSPPPARPADAFVRDPFASVFSAARAADVLGWRPSGTLVDLDAEKAARLPGVVGLEA